MTLIISNKSQLKETLKIVKRSHSYEIIQAITKTINDNVKYPVEFISFNDPCCGNHHVTVLKYNNFATKYLVLLYDSSNVYHSVINGIDDTNYTPVLKNIGRIITKISFPPGMLEAGGDRLVQGFLKEKFPFFVKEAIHKTDKRGVLYLFDDNDNLLYEYATIARIRFPGNRGAMVTDHLVKGKNHLLILIMIENQVSLLSTA